MAYRKKQKMMMRERGALSEDEEGFRVDEGRPTNRDYITLKNKVTKHKPQNEEELLQYYTTDKFNQYYKTLTPNHHPSLSSQAKKEVEELRDMLIAGHNVCVFGRGSKIDLLKTNYKKYLSGLHAFEVRGYLPSVSEKKIYTHFGGFLMDVGLTKKIQKIALKDQLIEYKTVLDGKCKQRVVVLFHSIDGPNLMSPDSQEKLSDLFEHQNIQLVCSLDSIKMVMHWSPITLQKYKFLFFNVDTRQPYIEELRHRSFKNENRETTEESLMYVWQSLNKNQKHIVKFLAQNALRNIGLDESQTSHLTFTELLDICIEEVVLSSDHQLRQNLLELLDHKVIMEKSDEKRNKKIYVMRFEKRILEKVIDMKVQ